MTARPVLAVAVLGLLAAGTVRAEPPARHAVPLRAHWKAGDVFTHTGEERETTRIRFLADGQLVSDRTLERQVTYNGVGRVVEVDDAGHATKTILYFLAWNRTDAGTQDGSLSGVFVEASGRGKAGTSRVLTPDAPVTAAARRWLDERFGRGRGGVDLGAGDVADLLEPAKALAVGETWTPDTAPVAGALAANLPVVTERVAALGRLEAVEGGVARASVALTIPLRGLRTGESSPLLAWKEGGTLERTLRSFRPTTGGFEGTDVQESTLTGIANAQGADVDFDQVERREVVVRAGGAMPPLPEAPRAAGPVGK